MLHMYVDETKLVSFVTTEEMDTNGSGEITFEKFCVWLAGGPETKKEQQDQTREDRVTSDRRRRRTQRGFGLCGSKPPPVEHNER